MGARGPKAQIMDEKDMRRTITRIAHEIVEANGGTETIALAGIVRRGKDLAELIADELEEIGGVRPPVGSLDISFYRDDVLRHIQPVLHATNIPYTVDGKDIVLVDDVLFTGRTVRGALDAIMDFGRPSTVQLVVMVDRGHRELPIRADYVGKNVPSATDEDVRVLLPKTDGTMAVEIWDMADTTDDAGKES